MKNFLRIAAVIFLIMAAVSFGLYIKTDDWKMLVPSCGSLMCAAVEWWTLIQWKKYD